MYFLNDKVYFQSYFLRFCAVGVANTANYAFMYLILIEYVNYTIAHVVSFIISAFCSYFLTTIYTFKSKVSVVTMIKFPLTFAPNLFFSTFLTYVAVSKGFIGEELAGIIVMIISVPITFAINKLVFLKRRV